MDDDKKMVCPECGCEDVFTTHEQAFMVNTGDHYCHMVKTQDPDSKAGCLDCMWRGERSQLVTKDTEGEA
jgi:hypothetical protein